MKYEVWKMKNGDWGWRLIAVNGEIIASGEGFKNKKDCIASIKLVQSSSDAPIEVTV